MKSRMLKQKQYIEVKIKHPGSLPGKKKKVFNE